MAFLDLTFITHALVLINTDLNELGTGVITSHLDRNARYSRTSASVFVLNGNFAWLAAHEWWTCFWDDFEVTWATVILTAVHKTVVGDLELVTKRIVAWCWEFWARKVGWDAAWLASDAV